MRKRFGILFILTHIITFNSYAQSIEGYWKSINDRTGELVSLIEIKKESEQKYGGTIIYRYPNASGVVLLTHCRECPEPYTNQPVVGLKILSNIVADPNKAGYFKSLTLLDPRDGSLSTGTAFLMDKRRLQLRVYDQKNKLGRTLVFIRHNKSKP